MPYLARYVVKWRGYDENQFSINRENNKDCVRVYDGFRGVWNKWKKQCQGHNLTHAQWIMAVLDTSKRIFEREVTRDLSGVGCVVKKNDEYEGTEDQEENFVNEENTEDQKDNCIQFDDEYKDLSQQRITNMQNNPYLSKKDAKRKSKDIRSDFGFTGGFGDLSADEATQEILKRINLRIWLKD